MRVFDDPFDTLLQLQHAMDRVMNEDFFGFRTFGAPNFPGVNVFRDKDAFYLWVEIPGVRKGDINIECRGDVVRIQGERRRDVSANEVSLHRVERPFGRFDRSLKLPSVVNADKVAADYQNGVVFLALPVHESVKPKQISIA